MDKFGVFRLLNSFLDFYSKSKSSENFSAEDNKNRKNADLSGVISSLFGGSSSAKNGATHNPVSASAQKNGEVKNVKVPLQNSMLSVMRSHDSAVKRIREKNGK